MRTFRPRRIAALLLVVLSLTAGCELLGGGALGIPNAAMPTMALTENRAYLIDPPNLDALALYFCPSLLGHAACSFFGPPPRKEDLQFRFQLIFQIDNPNEFPVPTTEILVGLHIYPGETFGELGAVCATFCEVGARDCPIPPSGACVHEASDIDTAEEFLLGAAQGGMLLLMEAFTGQPVGQQLQLTTIPGGESLELKVTFAIGIDPMLALIQQAAPDVLTQVLNSNGSELIIPYAVAGRVWFNIPYLGRVTLAFGPFGTATEPLTWRVL